MKQINLWARQGTFCLTQEFCCPLFWLSSTLEGRMWGSPTMALSALDLRCGEMLSRLFSHCPNLFIGPPEWQIQPRGPSGQTPASNRSAGDPNQTEAYPRSGEKRKRPEANFCSKMSSSHLSSSYLLCSAGSHSKCRRGSLAYRKTR